LLRHGAGGPFTDFLLFVRRRRIADRLSMIGLLGIGIAHAMGIGTRIAAAALPCRVLMWSVVLGGSDRSAGATGGERRPGAVRAAGVHAGADGRGPMSSEPNGALNVILRIVVPYVAIAVFVVGHYWRYRYGKFGWTTRSSQLYERRLLRLGTPLSHFGILLVAR
jgi:hypothetical protein